MFKKALLMLSVFFIALKVESSDQLQGLRYRGIEQIFYMDNLIARGQVVSEENIANGNVLSSNNRFNEIMDNWIPSGQVVAEENVAIGNVLSNNNRFNGITVIGQNQVTSQNQELDKGCEFSQYGCCFGMGLCAYWATGSASMGVATPVIVAVTAACMHPGSIE